MEDLGEMMEEGLMDLWMSIRRVDVSSTHLKKGWDVPSPYATRCGAAVAHQRPRGDPEKTH